MSLTSTNIKKYLKNKDTSFKLFDIKYTEKEKQTINNFKIDNEVNFSYKISADKTHYQLLYKFIESIGNNDEKDITIIINIIYKLLDIVSKGYNSNTTLNIQIMLPNKKSYLPAWHIDSTNDKSNLKFIAVLRGPGTLFIDNNKAKKAYFEVEDLMIDEIKNKKKLDIIKFLNKYNKIIAKKLGDYKIIQPKNNQVKFNQLLMALPYQSGQMHHKSMLYQILKKKDFLFQLKHDYLNELINSQFK